MTRFARFAPTIGVVCLVLCLGLGTAAGLTYRHARAWVAAATRVKGTVTRVEAAGEDDEGDKMSSTTVRFTDSQGGDHEVRTRSESPAQFAVGATAPVLYPPGRPDEARIAILGELYLLPLALATVAGGSLLSGLLFLVVVPWLARRATPTRRAARRWLVIRAVVMVLFFLGGALTPQKPAGQEPPLWMLALGAVGCAILTPLVVAGLIALLARLPFGRRKWERPTLWSFLDFTNPLVFLHFAGLIFASVGLGALLTSFMFGLYQLAMGACALLVGLGILAGVRLGERLCSEKMGPEAAA